MLCESAKAFLMVTHKVVLGGGGGGIDYIQ